VDPVGLDPTTRTVRLLGQAGHHGDDGTAGRWFVVLLRCRVLSPSLRYGHDRSWAHASDFRPGHWNGRWLLDRFAADHPTMIVSLH